ncbi:hypothetical protein ADIARSV_0487 [Arcticibacter svalbardensis MN12-7]|uniref:Uncharacterized protein n=1 Tax=Arcticibacter svalbardensis MN12-7 TaxID=1150600 RepID=R9GX54_9SPHI|nr:hypothetical protein [Arcticibacter svalbardensis]EOR96341.1 hypothetical protein ADIARSV_0487 [Arcticibacter svalbardensis MN12-7]
MPGTEEEVEYGQWISQPDAEKCRAQYTEVLKCVKNRAFPKGEIEAELPDDDDEIKKLKKFYKNGYNGFIFSRDNILKLFTDAKTPEYLVIMLGSQIKTDSRFVEGEPTVVLIGCEKLPNKKEEETTEFKSLTNIRYEHPPVRVLNASYFIDPDENPDGLLIIE